MRSFEIPVSTEESATISANFPLSVDKWRLMMTILLAAMPGLVAGKEAEEWSRRSVASFLRLEVPPNPDEITTSINISEIQDRMKKRWDIPDFPPNEEQTRSALLSATSDIADLISCIQGRFAATNIPVPPRE